jgi:hypothetical protein
MLGVKMNTFKELYLNILTEETSPTTFTPIELLDDIRKKCFFSTGEYIVYSANELLSFCDDINKPLFSKLVKRLKHKGDYSLIVVYFKDIAHIHEIFSTVGYLNPFQAFKQFSMEKVETQLINFFKQSNKAGANFNSIDVCPELGCVIALNGSLIKTNRDFEKQLDHELNHYFEKLQLKFNKINSIQTATPNEKVLNEISKFYGIDVSKKSSFLTDLKYHLFDESEFRSMSANVFHDILNYNETHLKQLNFHEFMTDVNNCNYGKYSDISLQESILFAWICKQLSENRFSIIVEGILAAIKIKKNIFQKALIKSKNFLRSLLA